MSTRYVVLFFYYYYFMGGVLAASAVDRAFEPRSGQTIKFVFVASHLSMQH
jgi:hypothetical protein